MMTGKMRKINGLGPVGVLIPRAGEEGRVFAAYGPVANAGPGQDLHTGSLLGPGSLERLARSAEDVIGARSSLIADPGNAFTEPFALLHST